jgi:hypothetical protein
MIPRHYLVKIVLLKIMLLAIDRKKAYWKIYSLLGLMASRPHDVWQRSMAQAPRSRPFWLVCFAGRSTLRVTIADAATGVAIRQVLCPDFLFRAAEATAARAEVANAMTARSGDLQAGAGA